MPPPVGCARCVLGALSEQDCRLSHRGASLRLALHKSRAALLGGLFPALGESNPSICGCPVSAVCLCPGSLRADLLDAPLYRGTRRSLSSPWHVLVCLVMCCAYGMVDVDAGCQAPSRTVL